MKKQFLTTLAVMAVTLGMVSSVSAATEEGQEPADVNVTVAKETAIDVHPQQLTYKQIKPGNTATSADEERTFGSIGLENVGSTDIEEIWVNATQTTDPDAQFGSSNPSDFNAGNMLMLRPDPDSSQLEGDSKAYNFVNRREYATYNNTLNPEYISAPDTGDYYVDETASGTSTASDVAVGRFRMGDDSYFFAMPVGSTPGDCNGDSSNNFNTLLVAKKPHNSSFTIPVDFTADGSDPDGGDTGYNTISGRDYYIFNVTNNDASGYGVTANGNNPTNGLNLTDPDSGANREYDGVLRCDTVNSGSHDDADTPHVIRTRYNIEAAAGDGISDLGDFNTDNGAAVTQVLMSSSTLSPSESVKLDVKMAVPRGIPQGVVTEGELRVVVSTDTT